MVFVHVQLWPKMLTSVTLGYEVRVNKRGEKVVGERFRVLMMEGMKSEVYSVV